MICLTLDDQDKSHYININNIVVFTYTRLRESQIYFHICTKTDVQNHISHTTEITLDQLQNSKLKANQSSFRLVLNKLILNLKGAKYAKEKIINFAFRLILFHFLYIQRSPQ